MILSLERKGGPAAVLLFLAASFLLGGSGCSREVEETPVAVEEKSSKESADLIIALLPERNVFDQKQKYLPLQEYLSSKLELEVYFKILDNYEAIFAEILDNKVHGGFWGSMNGTIAQIRGGIEILARPVWPDNTSTYWGYIFTRKESGIGADPRTWRGKSIAFVNKATTAGFLYPLSLLRAAGIEEDPGVFFRDPVFTGSHDAAVMAVYQGEVDMGACKNTIYQDFIKSHPDVAKNLVILSESPPVPSNGLGVSPGLPEDLKRSLKKALLDMDQDPEGIAALRRFGALRFIETTFEDYRPVQEMAEQAGIDLAQWPLRDVAGARPYR